MGAIESWEGPLGRVMTIIEVFRALELAMALKKLCSCRLSQSTTSAFKQEHTQPSE